MRALLDRCLRDPAAGLTFAREAAGCLHEVADVLAWDSWAEAPDRVTLLCTQLPTLAAAGRRRDITLALCTTIACTPDEISCVHALRIHGGALEQLQKHEKVGEEVLSSIMYSHPITATGIASLLGLCARWNGESKMRCMLHAATLLLVPQTFVWSRYSAALASALLESRWRVHALQAIYNVPLEWRDVWLLLGGCRLVETDRSLQEALRVGLLQLPRTVRALLLSQSPADEWRRALAWSEDEAEIVTRLLEWQEGGFALDEGCCDYVRHQEELEALLGSVYMPIPAHIVDSLLQPESAPDEAVLVACTLARARTPVCRFFLEGRCAFGDACVNRHSSEAEPTALDVWREQPLHACALLRSAWLDENTLLTLLRPNVPLIVQAALQQRLTRVPKCVALLPSLQREVAERRLPVTYWIARCLQMMQWAPGDGLFPALCASEEADSETRWVIASLLAQMTARAPDLLWECSDSLAPVHWLSVALGALSLARDAFSLGDLAQRAFLLLSECDDTETLQRGVFLIGICVERSLEAPEVLESLPCTEDVAAMCEAWMGREGDCVLLCAQLMMHMQQRDDALARESELRASNAMLFCSLLGGIPMSLDAQAIAQVPFDDICRDLGDGALSARLGLHLCALLFERELLLTLDSPEAAADLARRVVSLFRVPNEQTVPAAWGELSGVLLMGEIGFGMVAPLSVAQQVAPTGALALRARDALLAFAFREDSVGAAVRAGMQPIGELMAALDALM